MMDEGEISLRASLSHPKFWEVLIVPASSRNSYPPSFKNGCVMLGVISFDLRPT